MTLAITLLVISTCTHLLVYHLAYNKGRWHGVISEMRRQENEATRELHQLMSLGRIHVTEPLEAPRETEPPPPPKH